MKRAAQILSVKSYCGTNKLVNKTSTLLTLTNKLVLSIWKARCKLRTWTPQRSRLEGGGLSPAYSLLSPPTPPHLRRPHALECILQLQVPATPPAQTATCQASRADTRARAACVGNSGSWVPSVGWRRGYTDSGGHVPWTPDSLPFKEGHSLKLKWESIPWEEGGKLGIVSHPSGAVCLS